MTGVIRTQLARLSETLADLKDRVRVAVAGELGRAVSEAVRQVVEAVASGRADPPRREFPPSSAYRRPYESRWDDDEDDDRWDRPRDRWADDPDVDDDRDRPLPRAASARQETSSADPPAVATAVSAGVYVARLWLTRKGTLLVAAGLGLGVGLLGVLGGPVARVAVAVTAAVGDVLGATAALGAGAARLDHV